MSLTSEVARSISLPAAGATSILSGFKVQRDEDIQVWLTPSGGSATLLVLGTHYTVTDLGETSAVINLVTATTAGDLFIVLSAVEYLQELHLRNQGRYLPETLESELDRIVRMIQQIATQVNTAHPELARALMLDVDAVIGSGAYNALSNRIRNMDDPTLDQDAATKAYVDRGIAGVPTGGGGTGILTVTSAGLPAATVTVLNKIYYVKDPGLPGMWKICGETSTPGTYDWTTFAFIST